MVMRRQYPPKERLWTITMTALQLSAIILSWDNRDIFFSLNVSAKQKFSINCHHVYYAEQSDFGFGRGFIGYPKGRNRDIKLVN